MANLPWPPGISGCVIEQTMPGVGVPTIELAAVVQRVDEIGGAHANQLAGLFDRQARIRADQSG